MDTIMMETVRESCLIIPTAFSPNGDGENEVWIIGREESVGAPAAEIISLYPDATVEIFDRWGRMVFRSDNGYSQPWDGTFNGKPLPMDSYHYVINLNNGTRTITGNVTIVK
jgi:gliding motility-associated-like protein